MSCPPTIRFWKHDDRSLRTHSERYIHRTGQVSESSFLHAVALLGQKHPSCLPDMIYLHGIDRACGVGSV